MANPSSAKGRKLKIASPGPSSGSGFVARSEFHVLLIEEDPSVSVVHNPEAHEVVAWGQGEMHLRVTTERLADRFGVAIATSKPTVGYRAGRNVGCIQPGQSRPIARKLRVQRG